jgi:phosphatidate cytidylyltransferase
VTQPEARKRSNLTLRWMTAGVLLPPLVWACWYGGWPFVAVVVVCVGMGVHEFYGFIAAKGARPQHALGIAATVLVPLIVYLGDALWANTFTTAALLAVLLFQLGKREIHEAISSVSATFFGVYYVGWLLAHAVSLRFASGDARLAGPEVEPQAGFFFIVLALVGALGSDAGAYFAGHAFGRHKLAPTISPGKTLEGALGGVAAAALGSLLALAVFGALAMPTGGLGFAVVALFGVVLAVASACGDLVESLLKRDAQLKDAGWVLPGVGGVLDRIDSALLAFPAMYYLLLGYYSLYRP